MQDNGKGVILAATWVLPILIVPRAWDYPDNDDGKQTDREES
jgi:hypothetical protein